MNKSNPEKKLPRKFTFIIGLIFALLGIVLFINVGAAARAVDLPTTYLFGAGQLIVWLFVYYIGMCLIIKGKIYLSKNVFIIIGAIVLFIAASILCTYALVKINPEIQITSNFFNEYNQNYADFSKYFSPKFLNYFAKETPIGGGLLGYTLYGLLLMGGGTVLALSIGITLAVFGLLLCFEPLIVIGIKKLVARKKAKKIDDKPLFHKLSRKEKNEFFRSAAEIGPEDMNEVTRKNETMEGISAPTFASTDVSPSFTQQNISMDSFTRPTFDGEPVAFQNTEMVEEPMEPIFEKREEIKEEETEHVEQIALDFAKEAEVEEAVDIIDTDSPLTVEEPKPIKEVEQPKVEEVKEEEKEEPFEWVPPPLDLLDEYPSASTMGDNQEAAEAIKDQINKIFGDFSIGASCIGYTIGPSVTRYHIQYNSNVSSSRVETMVRDISIRLGGLQARFEGVIEGEFYSGLEIANKISTMVSFKDIVSALPDPVKHPTCVGFGKNISGKVLCADFAEFPHLLVAGTTGSGKSIYIHSVIATLIMRMSPKDLRIVLVDPKRVEMTKYRDMPHLLCPIITDADKATVMMNKLVDEMNYRYSQFEIAESASDVKQYNEWATEKGLPTMPYIIAVLDEYADLVDTAKEISKPVVSIAQKARAAGIHILISTQRPSTNVITGTIKANLATRVALTTANYVDSTTIIGEGGAEKLLGKGDMLVQSPLVSRAGSIRAQGCFVNNKEIARVVAYLKEHYKTKYDETFLDLVDHSKEAGQAYVASEEYQNDAMDEEEMAYQSIKDWTMAQTSMSISKIQRECGVGFNRAGRFFARMQNEGVISHEKDPNTKGYFVLQIDKFSEAGRNVSSEEVTSIRDDDNSEE